MESPNLDLGRFGELGADGEWLHLQASAHGVTYRVSPRMLGHGSYGTVYLGETVPVNGRVEQVAIKYPRRDNRAAWGPSDARREFDRSKDRGIHVVRALDHSLDGANSPYVVFELIRGRTLSEMVQRESLSWLRLAQLVECLGSALANFICREDPSRQMFHGDICPTNVMWDEERDRFVVIDLGKGHTAQTLTSFVVEDGTFRTPETLDPSLQQGSGLPVLDVGNYIDIHMSAQTVAFGLTGQLLTDPNSTLADVAALPETLEFLLSALNPDQSAAATRLAAVLKPMLASSLSERAKSVPLASVAVAAGGVSRFLRTIAETAYEVTDTWQVAPGQSSRAFPAIECVEFSPEGDLLAVGGLGTVKIVDTSSGEIVGRLTGHKSSLINALAWSPDGTKLVATGNEDIWVWDVEEGRRLQRLHADDSAHAAAWNSAGLIVCGVDSSLATWDYGRRVGNTAVGHGYVQVATSVEAWPRRWLVLEASGGTDREARIWNAYTNTVLTAFDLGGEGSVTGAVSGDIACLGKADGQISTWKLSIADNGDVQVRQLHRWASTVPRGPSYSAKTVVALSPDGSAVATAHTPPEDEGATLEFWTLEGERLAHGIPVDAEVRDIAWSARNQIACGMSDGTVVVLRERHFRESKPRTTSATEGMSGVRYDHTLMPGINLSAFVKAEQPELMPVPGTLGGGNSTSWGAAVLATPMGLTIRNGDTPAGYETIPFENRLPSRRMQFAGDGMSLLATDEADIVVINLRNGKSIHLARNDASGGAACFDPANELVAAGNVGGWMDVFSIGEGRRLGSLPPADMRDDLFVSVAWSGSGAIAASAARQIAVWRTPNTEPEVYESATDSRVVSMEWSPEGSRLLVADRGGTCQVWKMVLGGGRLQTNFEEHTDTVTALSWSPDSQYCATGDSTGAVYIWRSAAGAFSRFIQALDTPIGSISWSADQSQLLIANAHGTEATVAWLAGRSQLFSVIPPHA